MIRVVALLLGAGLGLAARPAAALTLADALALADASPTGRAAHAHTAAAEAGVDASGAWPATVLGATTTINTARAILTAAVPLPIFGTLAASRSVARAEADTAGAEESIARVDLRHHIERAWIELARAEGRAERAGAGAEREAELAAATQRRFDAGDAARVDVVSAEAQATRARGRAEAERDGAGAAAAELAGAIGLDPETPLHADGGLPEPPEVPPLATLKPRAAGHPEVRAATTRIAAEGAHVDAARADRSPRMSLGVEADIDDPTLPGSDLKMGLNFEMPFFGKTGAAVTAAERRRRAAELDRLVASQGVSAAIVVAHRTLAAARGRAVTLAATVLPAQREAARLARVAYDQGQVGLVTALEAERTLVDVEIEAIDARADAAAARADLARALGGSL